MAGDTYRYAGAFWTNGIGYAQEIAGNNTMPNTRPMPQKYYWRTEVKNCFHTNLLTGVKTYVVRTGGLVVQNAYAVDPTDKRNKAYAKAFDSFTRKITRESGKSAMGVTIAEARSSLTMISGRAEQLISAVSAIRKRNFGLLMDSLNLSRNDARGKRVWERQSLKGSARTHSSQLLEYTFGWVPLVNDMRAATKVLSSTPEPQLIVGRGRDSWHDTTYVSNSYSGGYNYVTQNDVRMEHRVQILGQVIITNPNLDLAERMGLANPIQLAWQVIPYSFLVDQFFGISQFLGRWSAMYGRSLNNAAVSGKQSCAGWVKNIDSRWGNVYNMESYTASGFSFARHPVTSLGTPTYPPYFRLPVSDLMGRAVTSVALLLQRLR